MLYAFIDTNILMHYPPLQDVDWLKMCGHQAVTVMLCSVVVDEVDQHRSNARLADRAKRCQKEIRDYRRKELRPNVTLDVSMLGLEKSDFPDEKIPEHPDEKIICLAKKFGKANGVEVAVVSADVGMELRAEPHGVEVIVPPDELRLPDPQSEEKKKLQELLKVKRPDLSVKMGPTSLELIRGKTGRYKIEEVLAKYEAQMGKMRMMNMSRQENTNRLRAWMENVNTVADEGERTIEIKAEVRNDGDASAHSVDVKIKFPPQITAVYMYHRLVGSRTQKLRAERLNQQMQYPPHVVTVPPDLHALYDPSAGWGTIRKMDDRIIFEGQLQTLKHRHFEPIFPLFLTFGRWEDVKPFAVEVMMKPLDPPDEKIFNIPIDVKLSRAEDAADQGGA
jgi:hypothetical protein